MKRPVPLFVDPATRTDEDTTIGPRTGRSTRAAARRAPTPVTGSPSVWRAFDAQPVELCEDAGGARLLVGGSHRGTLGWVARIARSYSAIKTLPNSSVVALTRPQAYPRLPSRSHDRASTSVSGPNAPNAERRQPQTTGPFAARIDWRPPIVRHATPSPDQQGVICRPVTNTSFPGILARAVERIRTADPFITREKKGHSDRRGVTRQVTHSPLWCRDFAAEPVALGRVHDGNVPEVTGVSGPIGPNGLQGRKATTRRPCRAGRSRPKRGGELMRRCGCH